MSCSEEEALAAVTTPTEEEVVEEPEEPVDSSPDGRFFKFDVELGRGSFKTVFKGLDIQSGVNVAWCELQVRHHSCHICQLCISIFPGALPLQSRTTALPRGGRAAEDAAAREYRALLRQLGEDRRPHRQAQEDHRAHHRAHDFWHPQIVRFLKVFLFSFLAVLKKQIYHQNVKGIV